MTHSLHRCGRLQEEDYVWLLYHVKGVNDQDLASRLNQAIGIAEDCGAINWGDVKSGPVVSIPAREIKARLTDRSRVRGVFTTREQVAAFLRTMKHADLGLCVTISGPLEGVFDACRKAGVAPHTINYSLGVFGKKELLPEDRVLAITTMCGHHMVPDGLVARVSRKAGDGEAIPEQAAQKMAAMCPCGIFNQQRAAKLLRDRE